MKSCCVAIAKDEGHGIFEWALYHALIGFDSVIVYNNNSIDNTTEELARAARFADVRTIDWPMYPGQIQSYADALKRFGAEFDWFCMLDVDEFLVPLKHDGLKALLEDLALYSPVAIYWMLYGSNGHVARPKGLVTENYTKRAEKINHHIKSLFRSRDAAGLRFSHPHGLAGATYVDLTGAPVEWQPGLEGGKAISARGYNIARINHYHTKSHEDYERKLARGRALTPQRRADQFTAYDLNIIDDPIIPLKYAWVLAKIRHLLGESAA